MFLINTIDWDWFQNIVYISTKNIDHESFQKWTFNCHSFHLNLGSFLKRFSFGPWWNNLIFWIFRFNKCCFSVELRVTFVKCRLRRVVGRVTRLFGVTNNWCNRGVAAWHGTAKPNQWHLVLAAVTLYLTVCFRSVGLMVFIYEPTFKKCIQLKKKRFENYR